jgi:hypothetical protein
MLAHSRPVAYYVTDADGGRYVEPITLQISVVTDHGRDMSHRYLVHFDNEDQALGYLDRLAAEDAALKPADKPWWFAAETFHTWSETSEYPIPLSAGRLLERLYPTCEHGLSADLCAGPGHYPMDHPAYM